MEGRVVHGTQDAVLEQESERIHLGFTGRIGLERVNHEVEDTLCVMKCFLRERREKVVFVNHLCYVFIISYLTLVLLGGADKPTSFKFCAD